MAAISTSFGSSKVNGNSEATSATLKALTAEPVEEDDDTSSSGSSSDSSASDESNDDTSDEDSSSEGSQSSSSSAESSDADSESSDASSERSRRRTSNDGHIPLSPSSESDNDSDSDSDSGPEEYPFDTTSHSGPTAADKESDQSGDSSDDTSDSESAGTDSNSESEEDAEDGLHNTDVSSSATAVAHAMPQARPASSKLTQVNPAPIPVPPGTGKESTKRRNARRRAAKLSKREMHRPDDQITNPSTTTKSTLTEGEQPIADKIALFEARRKALLDAIATGGIEVGPSGETTLDRSFVAADGVKRKRTEESNNGSLHDKKDAAVESTDELLGDDQEDLSASQKRRRLDLGAGRRLVFGALGLRNPKNKEEEDRLRDKLQTDAQLRANQQLSSRPQPPTEEAVSINNEQDINAWRLKINYRAVECCYDGMELSPAPFPFQQRWDPQQQYLSASKKNKRGGQGKRTQRNHAQYYSDDTRPGKKGERYNPHQIIDDGYGYSYDEDADIRLNYDDTVSQDRDHDNDPENEISQVTDLDDLPSLPKGTRV